MLVNRKLADVYPFLDQYTSPMKPPERPILGRDAEMRQVRASLMRPELCNVILLGDAGAGKTSVVQGLAVSDTDRMYLEVDLARMIADLRDNNEMAARLKQLFDEVQRYCADEDVQIVLFMDEFHQIVQLSAAAVEALKPLLADSGTRGIRVIAATTYVEFRQWISPNQPLVERLQRINLRQPDEDTTVRILKGMAKRYGVENQFYNDSIYHLIYEYTNRYIPANSQPRKSLQVFDAMVGWYRSERRPMNRELLADVIMESEGVNIAFQVDAAHIKEELDKKVLSQTFATAMVESRLQICVAGLNNPSRPMSTFLFTGSSGVGKTELCKQLARLLFDDDRNLIRFDMTEYANTDSLNRFRSELTARVWARPYAIILLDEIEKACAPVTRILLQVLDDGRLTDDNNREVSFLNSYVIMTTNAGSEIYRTIGDYFTDDTGSGREMKKFDKEIRRSLSSTTDGNQFPPELLGRIDTIVPFQPLSLETLKAITQMKLKALMRNVQEKHGVVVHMDKKMVDYLVMDNMTTDSDDGGARTVVSKMEKWVVAPIARFVNMHPGVRQIGVLVKGQTAYDNMHKLISDAYVTVTEVR